MLIKLLLPPGPPIPRRDIFRPDAVNRKANTATHKALLFQRPFYWNRGFASKNNARFRAAELIVNCASPIPVTGGQPECKAQPSAGGATFAVTETLPLPPARISSIAVGSSPEVNGYLVAATVNQLKSSRGYPRLHP